ncbi:MAG: hypothetical protein SFT93_03200 [Rickettsiaceae bacterium]|nr:hypothetical protein [Rickettsiaceae bacterium]
MRALLALIKLEKKEIEKISAYRQSLVSTLASYKEELEDLKTGYDKEMSKYGSLELSFFLEGYVTKVKNTELKLRESINAIKNEIEAKTNELKEHFENLKRFEILQDAHNKKRQTEVLKNERKTNEEFVRVKILE